MLMKLKTSKEKAAERERERMEEYKKISLRYKKLVDSGHMKSDAVNICANEFNCSLPKVYTARKAYDQFLSECKG